MKKLALLLLFVSGFSSYGFDSSESLSSYERYNKQVIEALGREFSQEDERGRKEVEASLDFLDNDAFVKKNAAAIARETKVLVRGLSLVFLDSYQFFRASGENILKGLKDGSIKTSDDLLAEIEGVTLKIADQLATFLKHDGKKCRIFKKFIQLLLTHTATYPKRAFSCLHCLDVVTLDAIDIQEFVNYLEVEYKDSLIFSDKQIGQLKGLINSNLFDVVFECLEPVLREGDFYKDGGLFKVIKNDEDLSDAQQSLISSALALAINAVLIVGWR